MFWRKNWSIGGRNTRQRQVPPLTGSLPTEIDYRPSGTTGTVEAYLAFVRAEYEEMGAATTTP